MSHSGGCRERNENESIEEEEICCICLNLRAIRFCTISGGALSPPFGQFVIADTSRLGQKAEYKGNLKESQPETASQTW